MPTIITVVGVAAYWCWRCGAIVIVMAGMGRNDDSMSIGVVVVMHTAEMILIISFSADGADPDERETAIP